MREVVVVETLRTGVAKGREGGALSGWHPVDLLADVLEALVSRTGVDPGLVDDVVTGCVSQVGEQSSNIGRTATLAAGFPESVPATTLDRQCGSSQQALHFAAQGILSGAYDVAVACGVESMSRVPMFAATQGEDPLGTRIRERYSDGLPHQGVSAEMIAARWQIGRAEADEYAAGSHQRAAEAASSGWTSNELHPVAIDRGDGRTTELLEGDEGIRPGATPQTIASLQPAFYDPDLAEAHPDLGWVVTAASSSQISDGAAAMLLMERSKAEALGLEPRAIVRETVVAGSDPILMLTGVIPATRKLLERAELKIEDIDVAEVNEAFAPVVLAWMRELGMPRDRVNIHGGAIANGHPLGASGVKLSTTLLNVLDRQDGRYGLQVMCEGGGMANATLFERVR